MVKNNGLVVRKDWYMSKTLWINILILSGGIITSLAGQLGAGIPMTGLGILNIILRTYTNSELKWGNIL